MNIQWDADKYTKDFSFVHQFGNRVLDLLALDSTMSVLDLGCGNGALTKQLSEMGVRAIGLDESGAFLQTARQSYPDLEFIQADATEFALREKVDAVFSNAVFHWIEREQQPALLRCVYAALKNNGQFVFEFGGHGNNRLIHAALNTVFSERGLTYRMPFFFPTIGEYAALLERAGFKVTYMTLFDRMTQLNGENGLADWLKMFVKKPFEGLAAEVREEIINQTVAILKKDLFHNGIWYADYVRIRGKAFKACA